MTAQLEAANERPTRSFGSKLGYLPHIDGLRAVAVMSVVFYHSGLGCKGGFVGVDVFFVISGFLITSLLLADATTGSLNLWTFWSRRIRRLMPALVVMTLITLAVAWTFLLPADLKAFGESMVSQVFLISNIYFWKETGYFSRGADTKPLLHTWSLAVEEQFYLLFPLLILLWAARSGSRRTLEKSALSIFALSLSVSVYGTSIRPAACFFLLPTRAWELLLGSILCLYPKFIPDPSQRQRALWHPVAWALVLLPVLFYSRDTVFPGLAALWPCLGTALLIQTGNAGWSGRTLASKPFRIVGLMSYSIYLWHWPILCFANYFRPSEWSLLQRTGLVSASLLMGCASYFMIEKPFRQRWLLGQRKPLLFAFSSALLLAGSGLLCSVKQGFPNRIPAVVRDEVSRLAASADDMGFMDEVTLHEAVHGRFVDFGSSKRSQVDLFVWGDSHAMAALPALDRCFRAAELRGLAATHSSAPPVLKYAYAGSELGPQTPPYSQAVLNYLLKGRIRNILMIGEWHSYMASGNRLAFQSGLMESVSALHAKNFNVYLLLQIPPQPIEPQIFIPLQIWHGKRSWKEFTLSKAAYLECPSRAFIHSSLADKCQLLDPSVLFYPNEQTHCVMELGDGTLVYRNATHLSASGSKILDPLIGELLTKLNSTAPATKF